MSNRVDRRATSNPELDQIAGAVGVRNHLGDQIRFGRGRGYQASQCRMSASGWRFAGRNSVPIV